MPLKRNPALTKKSAAHAQAAIHGEHGKYDRQVILQVTTDRKKLLDNAAFYRVLEKWRTKNYDPALCKVIVYDPSQDNHTPDGNPIYDFVDEGIYGNTFSVNQFQYLQNLTAFSRIYIDAHGAYLEDDLSPLDLSEYRVRPERLAEIIAHNVDRDKLKPKTDAIGRKRRLKISCLVCWGGLGLSGQAPDGTVFNKSFAGRLCYELYQRGVDCEVVGRLATLTVSVREYGTTSRKLDISPQDYFNPHVELNGMAFKDIGLLKVVFRHQHGKIIIENAYRGKHEWLDLTYDTLNNMLLEFQDMDNYLQFFNLVNSIGLYVTKAELCHKLERARTQPPSKNLGDFAVNSVEGCHLQLRKRIHDLIKTLHSMPS